LDGINRCQTVKAFVACRSRWRFRRPCWRSAPAINGEHGSQEDLSPTRAAQGANATRTR
jgi:hypothetical protein